MEVKVGEYNIMKVLREVDFGIYLDDGAEGILLPKRFLPLRADVGDELEVFIYHDGEERLIATTQRPAATVGESAKMRCVSVTAHGAFLDWGLMKDIFVPKSQQISIMKPQGEYLVKVYLDEETGRVAATERIEQDLNNDRVDMEVLQPVKLTVLRRTDIGYTVAIDDLHTGVIHHNEIYRTIGEGDKFDGFIKAIHEPNADYPEYRIDVAAGKPGYNRVEGEGDKILRLVKEAGGSMPYGDKSAPEEIYEVFGMSKKTFKMAIGKLYRERKLVLGGKEIQLVD